MESFSGRFVIAFNGEVYNHISIRKELKQAGVAPLWQGTLNTEVMLRAYLKVILFV